jgi:FkbM family methyltransferase
VSAVSVRSVVVCLKPLLTRTLYREGTVRTILRGPARGLRYRLYVAGRAPLYGGWEPSEQRLMAQHIRPGMVAYDIGANHGIHTLLMARLVGSEGHVYAFEPVPENTLELRANLGLNQFSNVTVLETAVCDTAGVAYFDRGTDHCSGHLKLRRERSNQFPVVTRSLDEFVFGEGHRPPAFIKVDVEGAESRVLSGAAKAIATYRPILLIALHGPVQQMAVGQILSELSYRSYHADDGKEGLAEEIIAMPEGYSFQQ